MSCLGGGDLQRPRSTGPPHVQVVAARKRTLGRDMRPALLQPICRGLHVRRYVADLLIALLQNYAAATALFPAGAADRGDAARGLPEPMLPGNWDIASGACLSDESLNSAVVQARSHSRHLAGQAPPRSMSRASAACITGDLA